MGRLTLRKLNVHSAATATLLATALFAVLGFMRIGNSQAVTLKAKEISATTESRVKWATGLEGDER